MYEDTATPVDFMNEYSKSSPERNDVDVEEYWRVIDGELIIPWYSPFVWNRKIKLANIHAVFYMHQKHKPCMRIKGWGMTFSPVWWASDWKRQFRRKTHYNVMIHVNAEDFIYAGFTVKNIDLFFEAIRPYISDTVTIYNTFPF